MNLSNYKVILMAFLLGLASCKSKVDSSRRVNNLHGTGEIANHNNPSGCNDQSITTLDEIDPISLPEISTVLDRSIYVLDSIFHLDNKDVAYVIEFTIEDMIKEKFSKIKRYNEEKWWSYKVTFIEKDINLNRYRFSGDIEGYFFFNERLIFISGYPEKGRNIKHIDSKEDFKFYKPSYISTDDSYWCYFFAKDGAVVEVAWDFKDEK